MNGTNENVLDMDKQHIWILLFFVVQNENETIILFDIHTHMHSLQ